MPERLPRRRIVRRRRHFDAVFSGDRQSGPAARFHGRALTLLTLPREPRDAQSEDEVAFLTPKRLGDASLRNRLRRRLREVHRRHIASKFTGRPPFRLFWMAKNAVGTLPFPELVAQMEALYASALARAQARPSEEQPIPSPE